MTEVLPPNSDINYAYVTPSIPAGGGTSTNFKRQRMSDFAGNAAINMASDADAIAAAGSTQGTAHALIDINNRITSGISGTGVKLPVGSPGQMVWITNSTTTTKFVYPEVGGQLNGLAINQPIALAPNAQLECHQHTTTGWEVRGFSESVVTYTNDSTHATTFTLAFPTDAFLSGMYVLRLSSAAGHGTINLPTVLNFQQSLHSHSLAHSMVLRVINSAATAPSPWVLASADGNWSFDTTGSTTGTFVLADGVTSAFGTGTFMSVFPGYYKDFIIAVTGATSAKVFCIASGLADFDGNSGSVVTSTVINTTGTGIHGFHDLGLDRAKNAVGQSLAAAATSTDFGFTFAVATGTKLVTAAANSSTVTNSVTWETILPIDYVGGTALQLGAFCDYVLGIGTVGTHTLAAHVYNVTDGGVSGADLVTTSARTVGATNGPVFFAMTSTGLVPGNRLVISLVLVIQDTGGHAITGEITRAYLF